MLHKLLGRVYVGVKQNDRRVDVLRGGFMLVLSRKAEESMYIGDDIKITVLDIRGGQVRIGITAPDEIKIHREEVYQRISKPD